MKKNPYVVSILMLLMFAILCLPTFSADKLYKIAVLPFDDRSIKGQDRWWNENWELGKGVSDELVTALLGTKKFRLIEREQIDKVLQEQDFGAGGRVDAQSAAKIGKILGVQYLVMGGVTEFTLKSTKGGVIIPGQKLGLGVKTTTARVVIDARLVNTSSAEIIASVPGKGEKKSTDLTAIVDWNAVSFGSDEFRKTNLGIALREAVNQVASGLASQAYQGADVAPSSLTGTIVYAKGGRILINLSSGDGVTVGMVFVVEHIIDEVKDPDTGEVLDIVTEPVAEIKITEVKDKTSTCEIIKTLSKEYQIEIKDIVKQKN